MPWTPAVVDLRVVSLPDRQDVRALFIQPPSCLKADGARRSNPLRAPLLAPYGRCDYARSYGTASRACTRGCVRSRPFDLAARADAWINARAADVRSNRVADARTNADKEPPCRTVIVTPYAAHLCFYFCPRKASRPSLLRVMRATSPSAGFPRTASSHAPSHAFSDIHTEKYHDLRPPSVATAASPAITRPLRRHACLART